MIVASARHATLEACERLLAPLASMLLRLGLTAADFSEVVREVFVTAAAQRLAERTRRVSRSRIAIVTGLTRSEVGRVLRGARSARHRVRHLHRADRVLRGWFADSDFVNRQGQPRTLPIKGRRGSFQDLVRRYSGDIPARAMLDELIEGSAVRLLANGTVRAVARSVVPPKITARDIGDLRESATALLETIWCNVESRGQRLFVSSTSSKRVDKRLVGLFLERVERHGAALLRTFEDQLAHPPRGFVGKGRNRGPKLSVTLFVHKDKMSRPVSTPR
jgi:Family of unknown function (DUF6502)